MDIVTTRDTIDKKIGVSNAYLDKIARFLLPTWLGVVPCDHLLYNREFASKIDRNDKEWSIIVNTAQSNEPYGHYISIYKNKALVQFFDPLGHVAKDENIESFLKSDRFKTCAVDVNKFAIQHSSSAYCGLMSLAFLAAVEKNVCKGVEHFTSYFFTDPPSLKNDDIAKDILVEIIRAEAFKQHQRRD